MRNELFEKLLENALNGQSRALALWSQYQFTGIFQAKDNEKALKAIEEILSQAEHPQRGSALSLRAFMHHHGQGTKVNYSEAIRLYQEAVQLGNSTAMNNLAYMYQRGQGVEVDYDKAIKLYQAAIELNNTAAMDNLAYMYINGQGVNADVTVSNRHRMQARDQLDNDTEGKAFLNMVAWYEQQDVFSALLTQLTDITDGLKMKQTSKPQQYFDVYLESVDLLEILSKTGKQFFTPSPTPEAFINFKETCDSAIKKAEIEFKKHRDVWNQIHPVIRGILGVLAALTVIPGLVVAVASKQGYMGTFFSTPETNSQQKLSAFQKGFDKMEDTIEQVCSNYETLGYSKFY